MTGGGGREEVSNFYVELVFCLTAPKKMAKVSLVFLWFQVPKILWLRGLGHRFLSKVYRLAVPQKIHRRTFQFVTNFGYRKFLLSRGMFHVFLLQNFCLTVPKNFGEKHFCAVFQKNIGSKIVFR